MSDDFAPIAQDLVGWLRGKPGVTNIQPPVISPKREARRSRLPFPLPKPPSAARGPVPSFEIHFSFKGQPRVFRYFVEAVDDPYAIRQTLKVHTSGELMIRVPDEYGGHLMSNDIHYGNRSATAASFGRPALKA